METWGGTRETGAPLEVPGTGSESGWAGSGAAALLLWPSSSGHPPAPGGETWQPSSLRRAASRDTRALLLGPRSRPSPCEAQRAERELDCPSSTELSPDQGKRGLGLHPGRGPPVVAPAGGQAVAVLERPLWAGPGTARRASGQMCLRLLRSWVAEQVTSLTLTFCTWEPK